MNSDQPLPGTAAMTAPASFPAGRAVRRGTNQVVKAYTELLVQVRTAGLQKRRRTFYISFLCVLVLFLCALGTGFVLLGSTWFQLLLAGGLGLLLTQFAFLSHELAHHQVFSSGKVNDWFARVLGCGVVGMSYSMWVAKHGAHHAYPNVKDKDPDIHTGVVAFHREGAETKHGLGALFTRHQGTLLFPLITFLGISLVADSVKVLFGRRKVRYRWLELALMGLRFGAYLAALFLMLPAGMAFAFLGVQLGVFGLYMGASFAPNHKGMPLLAADSRADFLTRQVLTGRNIRGGYWMDTLMGGLNHQVEHHLFPDMARPQLRAASRIVRSYCAERGIPYTETSLFESYGIVVRYLNGVGQFSMDPFDCPMVRSFRRP
ncbi:MAG TPA: acyl-CoA desaturase [Micrococcaceae bacterium]